MNIGIDLGSSNTVAALMLPEGVPALVPDVNRLGGESTPTKVLLGKDRVFVGQFAERMVDAFPQQPMITQFKRHFGSSKVLAEFQGKPLSSEALAALMLRKIMHDVEINTSRPVGISVITAPAHFNDKQRSAILRAADIAGLPVGAILDEPIAAALFYTHEAQNADDEVIMIYDLGGGTFDLTLLTYSANQLHIIAKAGLTDLGGRDFDELIYAQLARDYASVLGHPPGKSPLSDYRLRTFVEQQKMKVDGDRPSWNGDYLFLNNRFIHFSLDESAFLTQAVALLDRTRNLVTRTLKSIGMSLSDVHRLVLTGGASNAKYVHTYWQQLIDPSRQKIIRHQPLVSIAKGAAIYAGSLTKGNQSEYKSSYSMTNVSAYNVGIRTATSDVFFKLIDRNLPLPVMGRVEIQLPPGISGKLIISLGQYIDHPEDMDLIGEVAIATEHLGGGKRVLVIVENKSDGTLGLKIRNPADDQAIPFLFERNAGDLSNFEETKAFVQRISINAI
jgi:molecular chaperone DnaK (HSP70)